MKITIPLLVEEIHRPNIAAPLLQVRPLFAHAPQGQGDHLSRAIAKLTQALRKQLDAMGKLPRHDQLLRWTFCPPIEEHQLKARVILSRGTADCRVLVVSFEALGRRLAMMPAMHGKWFEVHRGQNILERTKEILTDHLEELSKEDKTFKVPHEFTSKRRQWITTLDLSVDAVPELNPDRDDDLMALLGGPTKMSGRVELQKVGRCLDWLYPQELDRAVHRDIEVAELQSLLASKDRRPVLLLGESLSGKTTILHECVFRRVQKAKSPHLSKRNIWLLSPPRLISGMMYVGQWENRVTAIIDEAIKCDHVLYFDDVLGLYYAGKSRDSDLTVAHVLKPYIERREFRMVAEMTPAAFRALQEMDRSFADLFHVLPVRPTDEIKTRQILFEVRRQLEGQHRCFFALPVLPAVLDLGNRYLRDSAQPGKSAQFYRQLASRNPKSTIDRYEVLVDFKNRSGLSLQFLDDRKRLKREDVFAFLQRRITGQDEAVAAMTDAVMIAKARLNDPQRPLATFLFLGPTGVGKTECAKALSKFLFNDEKRMLRFDMNEFLDASASARLNGTASDPEGLLTAAVRRQPFSVVLLDEIEKAHPDVYDLLLQVLGEGRLTDALGRTADFTNTIIIMTSNLGSRQAGAGFGLRSETKSDRQTYIAAAESFFRPEFFNRIDRIVPFEKLTREQIGQIAQRLIAEVLRRDGLVHRQCVMSVDPAALEKVIDEGYHPQLGARALKRSIERQLTGPVAAHLAGAMPDAPAVIHLYPARTGIAVRVHTLQNAERKSLTPAAIDLKDWEDVLDRVDSVLVRIEEATAAREGSGTLTQGELSATEFRYLAIREHSEHLRRWIDTLDRMASAPKRNSRLRPPVSGSRAGRKKILAMSDGDVRAALRSAADMESQLAYLEVQPQSFGDQLEDQLAELLHATALLQAMAQADGDQDRCVIWLRSPNPTALQQIRALREAYLKLFPASLGFIATDANPEFSDHTQHAIIMEMPGIASVMEVEQGTHLFIAKDQRVTVVQAICFALGSADADHWLRLMRETEWTFRDMTCDGETLADPFPLGPVIRTYDSTHLTIDLRSGLAVRGLPDQHELRKFILSQLPSPAEFQ